MADWTQIILNILGAGIGGGIAIAIFNHYSNKTISRYNLVNEGQFKIFNELWNSLMDLKLKADDLWEYASDTNLLNFANALKEASDILEKSSLIISKSDYDSLIKILDKFKEYRIGKTRLIDMDKGKIKAVRKEFSVSGARAIYDERLSQLSQNEDIRNEYTDLLNILRIKFHDKMGIK